jgi:hypothetical protein
MSFCEQWQAFVYTLLHAGNYLIRITSLKRTGRILGLLKVDIRMLGSQLLNPRKNVRIYLNTSEYWKWAFVMKKIMALVLYFPLSCTVSALPFNLLCRNVKDCKLTPQFREACCLHLQSNNIQPHTVILGRKQFGYICRLFWVFWPIGVGQDQSPLPLLPCWYQIMCNQHT